jgi:hypothetical protein
MDRRIAQCVSWRVVSLSVALAIVLAAITPAAVWAQSAGSTIHGMVKDESGGAMPGVTVTLSSAALQVGKMTVVTDADGNYRFGELPAGTYQMKCELLGFKTFVHEDLRLTIGFVARVDATMAIGGLEESVTVTGASPVVDLTTTTTSVNLTQDTLESVPIGRGLQQVLAMTPGVTTNRVDVGDSWMGVRAAAENYGQSANVKIQVDGIDIADGTSSGVYLTSMTLEEAQIRTSGNDAEVSVPGVSMVAVIKSGSNQFRGTYLFSAERPELQSSNLSERLRAQGLSDTEPLRHLYDVSFDVGGRVVRDKLWFYGAFVRQDKLQGIVGFASGPGPDGRYLTGDEPQGDVRTRLTHGAMKLSYQPTRANRLVAAWQPTLKYQPQGLPPEPNRFRPLESTLDYRNPSGMYKGEWQSTLSNRMVFNVVGGYGGYIADYAPWRSKFAKPVVKGNPPRFDRETTLNTGSNQKTNLEYRDKWQVDGGLGIFPEKFLGGQHELKTGTTIYWRRNSVGWRVHPAGDYRLIFDRVGGVSGTPAEIEIFNSPTQPDARASYYAGYVKDTWRVTGRLTLNLGLRIEQQRAFLPKQSKDASPDFPTLFPGAMYNKLDVLAWNSFVPRLGLAWDVGDKSVVKATFGRFANGLSDGFANSYNPLATTTMTFRWRDLDGNRDYTPGEVNLDPNEADFLNVSGTSSVRLNKDLLQSMTTETTVGYERELMRNLGVRVLYVFKNVTDQFATTNGARPYSAYNIPLRRRDPGLDGVLNTSDDGGVVTIYDYDPAFRGAAFVQNELRSSDRDDRYQTIEFTLTKRTSGRWGAMASFWAIKNHEWLTSPAAQNSRLQDNPNNDQYPLNETWEWAGNMSGSYSLPGGVQFSGFLQSKIGVQGQRTNIFRAVDPDGGPRLNQLSTVTLRLEPFGAQKGPAIVVVNLRGSKQFSFAGVNRLKFDVDLFNLFNSSAPITANFQSGPTFGYATAVVPPRIVRMGVKYSF